MQTDWRLIYYTIKTLDLISSLIDDNKKKKDNKTVYLAEEKMIPQLDDGFKQMKLIKESQHFQIIPNKDTER